jgi:soluble cytochrome b562
MNLRTLRYCLLLTLVLAVPSIRADAPAAAPAAPKEEKKTELEVRMEKIGKAAKALKKQIQDPAQNASSLELVAAIRAAAGEALTLTPAKAADLPEADRPKFTADFRAGLKEFIAGVDKLSAALKANDNAAAGALFKHLIDLEHKDHKQFRRPEKD